MARALPVLVVAVPLLRCGAESADPPAATSTSVRPPPAETAAPQRKPRRRGIRIKAIDSRFGAIVGDGRGQAVYIFDREDSKESECYGDCARAWPPVLTRGTAGRRQGIRRRLVGTTRRRNGKRQVTYDGRSLYYYVDDAPGRVLCHNVVEFGGLRLVVRPDGTAVG